MRYSLMLGIASVLLTSPAAAQIAGKYAFQAGTGDGQSIPGTIEITGSPSSYGGWIRWISVEGADSAGITQVSQQGSQVTVVGDNPTGRWTINVTFVADSFSGTYTGPESGPIRGKRATQLDLSGIYDFETGTPNGNKVGGRLVIRESAGQYSGTIAPEGNEPAQITRLTSQGADVTIEAGIPNGGIVVFKVRATGDSLAGTYQVTGGGNESGDLRARRIRK